MTTTTWDRIRNFDSGGDKSSEAVERGGFFFFFGVKAMRVNVLLDKLSH